MAKHRNGPTDTITVAFQGHYSPVRRHGHLTNRRPGAARPLRRLYRRNVRRADGASAGGASVSTTDAEGGARPPLTTRPAGGAREGRRARLRAGARDVAPALAVYAAIRLVGLLALAIYARNHDYAAFARLDTYDAPRLLRLAARGYDPLIPGYLHGRPTTSNIAFFPLYPLVVRAVAALPLVSVLAAGYLVTAVSGLVAAAGLDRFGRRLVPAANGGTRAATDAAAPRTARVGGSSSSRCGRRGRTASSSPCPTRRRCTSRSPSGSTLARRRALADGGGAVPVRGRHTLARRQQTPTEPSKRT